MRENQPEPILGHANAAAEAIAVRPASIPNNEKPVAEDGGGRMNIEWLCGLYENRPQMSEYQPFGLLPLLQPRGKADNSGANRSLDF